MIDPPERRTSERRIGRSETVMKKRIRWGRALGLVLVVTAITVVVAPIWGRAVAFGMSMAASVFWPKVWE